MEKGVPDSMKLYPLLQPFEFPVTVDMFLAGSTHNYVCFIIYLHSITWGLLERPF